MVEKPDYFRYEKGKELKIKRMTPEQYLEACAKIHKGTVARERAMLVPRGYMKYADQAEAGAVFPIPVLDYVRNGQEGRHRAWAAKELMRRGVLKTKTIPVAVILPVKPSEKAMDAYWKRRYGFKPY